VCAVNRGGFITDKRTVREKVPLFRQAVAAVPRGGVSLTRMPRRHRDRDALWWMHESGLWAQRYDEVDDLDRARRLPSPQLAGGAEVDLEANRMPAGFDEWAGCATTAA
jgi:hypothetical protein